MTKSIAPRQVKAQELSALLQSHRQVSSGEELLSTLALRGKWSHAVWSGSRANRDRSRLSNVLRVRFISIGTLTSSSLKGGEHTGPSPVDRDTCRIAVPLVCEAPAMSLGAVLMGTKANDG